MTKLLQIQKAHGNLEVGIYDGECDDIVKVVEDSFTIHDFDDESIIVFVPSPASLLKIPKGPTEAGLTYHDLWDPDKEPDYDTISKLYDQDEDQ